MGAESTSRRQATARKAQLVLLAAALSVGGTVVAQPDTQSPVVKLKIQNVTLRGGQKLDVIRVGPRGAGVCKKPDPGELICGNRLTFRWIGSQPIDRSLKITFQDAPLAKQCFGLTQHPIELTRQKDTQTLTVDANCPITSKTALFYTVSCEDTSGGDCGGIASVDPGVIIEPGGP